MSSPQKPLLRSLGEFFGHVARGFKAPLTPPPKRTVVREEVQEQRVETPRGQVTLRRTTIDEIEGPAAAKNDHPA